MLRAGLQALFAAGARQALAGEFTKRAFLNGRMDLTQAEAVIDLIHAETTRDAKNAAGQLGGAVLRRAQSVYDALQDIASHYHAVIDYPDEDIPDFRLNAYEATMQNCITQLQCLLDTFSRANVLHGGVPAVILGRPNAGKSTLINAIMGKKIAITSNTAQTTRHRFRAVLTREGFQLILVDTPGLHKPHDALGEELNTSALKALEDVDVVAFLVDASKPVGTGDEWVAAQLKRARSKKILVLSKIDLVDGEQLDRQRFAAAQLGDWDAVVELSSQTGEHVQDFVDEVVALLPPGPAWFPTDMETDQPIESIARQIGVENTKYFFVLFKKFKGMTPRQFRCKAETSPL